MLTVLAVDPGTVKCGLAVVTQAKSPDSGVRVVCREIVETERLVARALVLAGSHDLDALLVGNATNGATLARALRDALPARLSPQLVNEAFTSQRARARFLREHPPENLLARLVPMGLRTPPRPYDDYVAVLLAEDWFAARASASA